MKLSNRIEQMTFSPIRKLIPYSDAAEKKGLKVYKLNIGQPNIKTPDSYFEAVRSFNDPIIKYLPSVGYAPFVTAVSNYLKKFNINYDTSEILITQGGSEAILFVFMCLCDKDDEILVPEPFYSNYANIAFMPQCRIKPIPTHLTDNFHLPKKEDIEKLITSKTKAIMISNPGNPTGTVYRAEEIQMLGEIVKKHNIFLIADEVYRDYTYDNNVYTSAYTIKDLNNLIMIDSMSKHYSSCGARVGFIASKNKEFIENTLKLCQSRLSVSALEQYAAAAVLNNTPEEYIRNTQKEYTKRRNLLYKMLLEIPGVQCGSPEGAFYLIVKLPVDDTEKFAKWILTSFEYDNSTLLMSPAAGFYATPGKGIDQVRIAFSATTVDDIKEAMTILSKAIEAYNKIK